MKSPFKFLDSYTREDREIFFGRDRETEELYRKVYENRILLIYGLSGTGKTSLINCGLGNKIAESDWLPVTIRRGNNILESLWHQLEIHDTSGNASKVKDGKYSAGQLVKKLQSVYLDHFKPVYLIFDQFEELFIFGSREERREFISVISSIVKSDVQCKVLISIREEYLANITEFEREIPDIMQNRLRVEKMGRANAIEAIGGPCRASGIELEEGFEEALLNKIAPEGKEIELTYLQVFLDKIFRLVTGKAAGRKGSSPDKKTNEQEKIKFTHGHLKQLGDVGDLLGDFLEEQIRELDDPDAGLAILKSFVSIRGTKRQITMEEVLEASRSLGKDVSEQEAKELVNRFVDLRLLREKDESGRYELRHDSLAAKIFEKITLVEKEVMEVRQFIENAYQAFLARKTLLSEDDLKYIAPYEDRLFLGKELQSFFQRSKYDIETVRRSFRRSMVISVAGFLLIIAAAWYYYYQQNQYDYMRLMANASFLQEEFIPELSLVSAREAYLEDTAMSLPKNALLEAFYTMMEKVPDAEKEIFEFQPCESLISFIDLSDDGRFVFGYLENNDAKVWDLDGNEHFSSSIPGASVEKIRMSPDNAWIGLLRGDSTVWIISLLDSSSFVVPTTPNGVNDKYLFDFSGRKEFLVGAILENRLILYRKDGTVFQKLEMGEGKINAMDISPDRRFVAAAGDDDVVYTWYFNTLSGKYAHYSTIDHHRDNIRSCRFNSLSNYILTSSDDSLSLISKLDGTERIRAGRFATYPGIYSGWLEDRLNSFTLGKECDAYFTGDERIIVVRLRNESPEKQHGNRQTNLYLLHDESSDFEQAPMNRYFNRNIIEKWHESEAVRYEFLVPSPDTRSVAAVIEGSGMVKIAASDHTPILAFEGTNPVYTADCRYIFSINGNRLEKHVIEAEEVIDLVWDRKIFGDMDYNIRDWIVY
ncbi:MAG: hypothetical protein K9J30_13005 [Bacteroidales bacterium]|nr:hypothetical protein [Bacteroidales bacterium]